MTDIVETTAFKPRQQSFRHWLQRYLIAELLGTLCAAGAATLAYRHSHSPLAGAAAGLVAEGFGFYGFLIASELATNHRRYRHLPFGQRLARIAAASSTNLLVQFAPAEVVDSILIRPVLFYYVPQHIQPYTLGFIIAKFMADALFYVFALGGYRLSQRWHRQ